MHSATDESANFPPRNFNLARPMEIFPYRARLDRNRLTGVKVNSDPAGYVDFYVEFHDFHSNEKTRERNGREIDSDTFHDRALRFSRARLEAGLITLLPVLINGP